MPWLGLLFKRHWDKILLGGVTLALVFGGYFWLRGNILRKRDLKDQQEITRRMERERDVLERGDKIRRRGEEILKKPGPEKDRYMECTLNAHTFEEMEKCVK